MEIANKDRQTRFDSRHLHRGLYNYEIVGSEVDPKIKTGFSEC
jgi:hypothetical protein